MKVFFAAALLATISLANATEVMLKDVSRSEIKRNATVSAGLTVDLEARTASVAIETATFREVGPRNTRIKQSSKVIVPVEGLRLEDTTIVFDDVSGAVTCGTVKVTTVGGPRSNRIIKTLKLTGRCAVEVRKVKNLEGDKRLQVVLVVE